MTQSELVQALREQLQASEAVSEGLRSDKRRLQAALAVERGAQASEELQRMRRVHVLDQYRVSRLLRVFDALDVPQPKITDRISEFVTDELLDSLRSRLNDAPEVQGREKRKEERGDSDLDRDVDMEGDADGEDAPDRTVFEDTNEQKLKPSERPREQDTGTTTLPVQNEEKPSSPQTQKSVPSTAFPDSSAILTAIIDDSNPAAECLRILIGATNIAVYENPRRIKITITNEEKHREASFWLAWKDGSMEYTQQSLTMEDDVCPDFLKEYAIDFDVAQAPRFLLLVMGALFDMNIEPKADSQIRASMESEPPQEEE